MEALETGWDSWNFKTLNLKLMVVLLLVYMVNTIFYFSLTVPDFYLKPMRR